MRSNSDPKGSAMQPCTFRERSLLQWAGGSNRTKDVHEPSPDIWARKLSYCRYERFQALEKLTYPWAHLPQSGLVQCHFSLPSWRKSFPFPLLQSSKQG